MASWYMHVIELYWANCWTEDTKYRDKEDEIIRAHRTHQAKRTARYARGPVGYASSKPSPKAHGPQIVYGVPEWVRAESCYRLIEAGNRV